MSVVVCMRLLSKTPPLVDYKSCTHDRLTAITAAAAGPRSRRRRRDRPAAGRAPAAGPVGSGALPLRGRAGGAARALARRGDRRPHDPAAREGAGLDPVGDQTARLGNGFFMAALLVELLSCLLGECDLDESELVLGKPPPTCRPASRRSRCIGAQSSPDFSPRSGNTKTPWIDGKGGSSRRIDCEPRCGPRALNLSNPSPGGIHEQGGSDGSLDGAGG